MPTVKRWLDILLLSLIGAVTFEVLIPVGAHLASALSPASYYSTWFINGVAWLGVVLLVFLLTDPLRFHVTQLGSFFQYPPLWVAVALGISLAVSSEHLAPSFTPQVNGVTWQEPGVLLALVSALVVGVSWRHISSKKPRARRHLRAEAVAIPEWKHIAEWFPSEEPASQDLFDQSPVAARIAAAVCDSKEDRAIALLGAYGSGKTSILNWVRQSVDDTHGRQWIVADVNCWAIRHAEEAPRVALQSIIGALEQYVDVQALRGLPGNYQRIIAAEPSGLLQRVFGAGPDLDPEEELQRLTPFLLAIDRRLLVILEDADRAGTLFDSRHLERLLWTFRSVARVSFVIAFDQTRSTIDYQKLCDIIELVPKVDVQRLRQLLSLAYQHWLQQDFIDPVSDRLRQDRLRLGNLDNPMVQYAHRLSQDTAVDALVALLGTPRSIKHFIRRMDTAWRSLVGEIDLDDLVILTAIRQGAPAAFSFLVDNIDPARHKPTDFAAATQTVRGAWDTLLDEIPEREAVERLIHLLGIIQLNSPKGVGAQTSPQGVQQETDSTDYFRRALAGQLAPGEIRDQRVLSDTRTWQSTRQGQMMSHLLSQSEESKSYLDVWEHFAYLLSDAQLREVADVVINSILARDGARSSFDNPGMGALWRRCVRRSQDDAYVEWLSLTIRHVLPTSLQFGNDLFKYFGSTKVGSLSGDGRAKVRTALIEAVKETCRDADALMRCLSDEHPSALFQLINGPDGEHLEPVSEWVWLGPVILQAMRNASNHLGPHIALLLSDFNYKSLDPLDARQAKPIEQQLLNMGRARELFGDESNEVLKMLGGAIGDDVTQSIAAQARGALEGL